VSGRAGAAADHPWTWPIDVSRYDRNADLSAVERAMLDRLAYRTQGLWPRRAYTELDRLLRPLHDAMDAVGLEGAARRSALRPMVVAMARTGRPFWGWSDDDWREVLGPRSRRQRLLAFRYLLCGFARPGDLPVWYDRYGFAARVFGQAPVDVAVGRVTAVLLGWGYRERNLAAVLRMPLCEALLRNRSPRLEDLTPEVLDAALGGSAPERYRLGAALAGRALLHLGLIDRLPAAASALSQRPETPAAWEGVPAEWLRWCLRWRETSTLAPSARTRRLYAMLQAGRWLARTHPEVTSPAQWTRELAAEFVAAVDRMTVGQYAVRAWSGGGPAARGKPLRPRAKHGILTSVRAFLRECHEWGWLTLRFDPRRALATPRSILALIAPDPRVIADDVWAKLLAAGLRLREEDLPAVIFRGQGVRAGPWYPAEMVRAVALVWLFAGLRSDEIRRLRVGCVRWQRGDAQVPGTDEVLPRDAVCLLDVPTNKGAPPFTKPVDRVVGEAIGLWERVRLAQPDHVDAKAGEVVQVLFAHRGKPIARTYINKALIPILCRKAGVPERDARGGITSHRARSTIASQLFNAKEPMTLFELQDWLGHRSPGATQHYAKVAPTKLAKAYADAGYFARNVRAIEVLVDQRAVRSGAAAAGAPWKYYDLGHGYCTYDFYAQCPHRMACARCSFYVPKDSSRAQVLEGKANLARLREEMPLTDDELAAVEDGVALHTSLVERLADLPTPAGPTPRQLLGGDLILLQPASGSSEGSTSREHG
jgi:integrase